MRILLDPDFPLVVPGPVVLAAIAVAMWRRWRGRWRALIVVPIGFMVTAVVVARPMWWDEAHVKEWAGLGVLSLHAGVIVGGLIVAGLLVLLHAANRARETDERS